MNLFGNTQNKITVRNLDKFNGFINNNYFESLNGIRAICALAVIKAHSEWNWVSVPKLLNYGNLGVDMFFTISGFLIVTLLLREKSKNNFIDLRAFYVRRTLRIFPIYYLLIILALLFCLAISPWKPNSLIFYKDTFPVLLTYTQNIFIVNVGLFFHCWSLAMEEQFYLVWPWVEKFFSFLFRILSIILVLIISQLCNFGFFKDWINNLYNNSEAYLLPMYLITFTPITLGVCLAYILNNRHGYSIMKSIVGSRISPIILFLILVLICEMSVEQGLPRLLIHITMTLIVSSLVIREDHYAKPLLKNRALFYLGTISYGLYLYHVVIMSTIIATAKILHYSITPSFLCLVTATITILVAHISYQYFEKPIIGLKNKLIIAKQ